MERTERPGPASRPFDPLRYSEIQAYLEHISASPPFSSAPRRVRLLRYLVDRTLAGEGDRLTEYSIGLDVFEKDTSFDPRIDSMVRTDVMRLRQRLRQYYLDEGRADPIVLDLPARSYRVSIVFREATPVEAPAEPAAVAAPAYFRPRRIWVALAAMLLVAGALALVAWRRFHPRTPVVQSLVVLPFQDYSANHQAEYLADGLTDEITNDLANVSGLHVIARTSAFEFKGKDIDIRQIGRLLNVEAALEGSLVRQGDRVHIRAQLNRTSDGYHLWSHAYDIDSRDLIGIQEQIAESISGDLNLSGGPQAPPHGRPPGFTTNPEAHDLYLRGMAAFNAGSGESFHQAADLFQAAIDKDQKFAMAWLGLARAHDLMESEVVPGVSYQQREAEAKRALELDPGLAAAHGVLAEIAWVHDHDWPRAEQEFLLATKSNGSFSAHSHAVYGVHLAERRRFAESHQQLRTAEELSPIEPLPFVDEAWAFFYERRYDQAERTFRAVIEAHPNNAAASEGLGLMKTMLGDCPAGAVYADKLKKLAPDSFFTRTVLWNLMVCEGRLEPARRLLNQNASKMPAFYAACSYAVLGDKETAFTYLDRAVTRSDKLSVSMDVNPYLDSLHGDPRFAALERRVGLAPAPGQ